VLNCTLSSLHNLCFVLAANSARARLVRLTEAAKNLKKRATNSVRMGKENEAVELLVQKKKLTKALEIIKERIGDDTILFLYYKSVKPDMCSTMGIMLSKAPI
jgi:hypothetical protein